MDVQPILTMYPAFATAHTTPLAGAGGFSGALFWKVHVNGGDFCLRRWPSEHPTSARLRWIHGVLGHVYDAGQKNIPLPIPNDRGETFSRHGDHLWELSPWMPGQADFESTYELVSKKNKLTNAMTALALFHRRAATYEKTERHQTAPGIEMRRNRYLALRHGGLYVLRQAVEQFRGSLPSAIVDTAMALLDEFSRSPDLGKELDAACQIAVSCQPCIRDIWHNHVLFTGETVTGIVDFGALKMASIAGDVARLLGSLAADDRQLWEDGLKAYQASNPVPDFHGPLRRLIKTWDDANVILSGLQWVHWLFVDGRQFQSYATVHQRMTEHLTRLRKQAGRQSP